MLRAYKYRIYPNATQREKIERTFGVCRLVYNMGLSIKIDTWKNLQKNVSAFDLCYQLTDLKKECPWVAEVDSQALQASVKKLDVAYRNFFNGSGYPKFKKKSGKQGFRCPNGVRRVDFDKKTLTVPKIKDIPVEISRRFTGRIMTVTISRNTTGKYFAGILVDTLTELPKKQSVEPHKTIGIDVGLKNLIITSDGIKVDNPAYLKNSIGRLKVLQRGASRKTKGSNNHRKANLRVAILHERIRNKRIDYLHKLTTGLVRDNQATTFCVEDLAVSNMTKNRNLAQAISDVSWAEFKRQMEYKCEWNGKNLITIGRFEPSTKTCHNCNVVNQTLTLSDREWVCAECGSLHDRDINAARNIRKMGLAKHSGRGTPGEPAELSHLAKRRSRNLKKPTLKKVSDSI